MAIRQFELFHGAVLTKLVRRGQRVALTMIETSPNDPWAVYTINDAVDVHSLGREAPFRGVLSSHRSSCDRCVTYNRDATYSRFLFVVDVE
jgi:hypothetical protein